MGSWVQLGINSLWPSDAIWPHRSESTFTQMMACWLVAPSHHLNQCWHLIGEVLQHSLKSDITSAQATILYNQFENCTLKSLPHLPGANKLKHTLCTYLHDSYISGRVLLIKTKKMNRIQIIFAAVEFSPVYLKNGGFDNAAILENILLVLGSLNWDPWLYHNTYWLSRDSYLEDKHPVTLLAPGSWGSNF